MWAERPAVGGVRSVAWTGATWRRRAVWLAAGTAFLAASARISIPLPFTPVPITAQTLAVLLIGALYGSRLGAATVLAYLAEGLVGLPVFHQGTSGPAVLLGPTGGYLAGFVVAAFAIGWLIERADRPSVVGAAVAFLAGDIILNLVGALWLARFVGVSHAWTEGILPFLPGEAIKIAVATAVVSSGRALLRRDAVR